MSATDAGSTPGADVLHFAPGRNLRTLSSTWSKTTNLGDLKVIYQAHRSGGTFAFSQRAQPWVNPCEIGILGDAGRAPEGHCREVSSPKHVPSGDGFVVLVNAEGVHSLWPNDSTDPPAGWTVVPGPAGWGACLDYVDRHLGTW